MKLYSAKIRLNGSMLNEAIRENLTAAEIALLRVLHGNDAVVDIKHTANVKGRSDKQERDRLAGIYSYRDQAGPLDGPSLVLKYLGAPGVPLPQEVEVIVYDAPEEAEVVQAVDAEEIEPVAEPVAVHTTKIPRKRFDVEGTSALTG